MMMAGDTDGLGGVGAAHPSDALQSRLIDFAVTSIRLAGRLPQNQEGRHVSNQMLRSGTSPAPNYGEARAAESSDDFIHKLKLVLKELNETLVWLQVIERGKMIPAEELKAAMDECDQLCRIIAASINTERRRRDGK